MAVKRSRKKSAASRIPSGFDKQFALDTTLRLAEAAYAVADGEPPALPPGYALIGSIEIDPTRAQTLMQRAPVAQQRMLRTFVDEGHIGGCVARCEQTKTLALSFRGTRTPEEWLKDLDFVSTPYTPVKNWGRVHKGFQLVYLAMRGSVKQLIKAGLGNSAEVWITGHSLGAAVAVLCAPDVANTIDITPRLHTYAGPRSGERSFEEKFDKRVPTCFRVVNRWDIVPHLPPPIAHYRHVGVEVQVDGGFTVNLRNAHDLKSYRRGLERLTMPVALIGVAA
jgi:predicted lipase